MQIILDIFLFVVYSGVFIFIVIWTWKFWSMYVAANFMTNMNFVLLEIKLPREIFKSPESMEIVAGAFLQGGGVGNWYLRNWRGAVPTFFSLEIASLEGDVRFYARCEKKFVQLLSNNFYSQYPGIEIKESEDYINKIFYDHRHKHVSLWGLTNKLSESFKLPNDGSDNRKSVFERISKEKDSDKKTELEKGIKLPADYKMLKTYLDFKQDKDPKEEFKHDPLTPVLEWLGSMRAGEYAFYQLIVQDAGKFDGKTFPKTYQASGTDEGFTLKELADERRKQIRSKEFKPKFKKGDKIFDDYGYPVNKTEPDGVDENGKPRVKEVQKEYQKDDEFKLEAVKESDLTEESKEELKMISRKLQKPILRAAMRVMYVAKKDEAKIGQNAQSVLSIFKQYTAPGYNGFSPTTSDPYNYNWEDTMKRRKPWRSEELFEAYAEREGFYPHITERKKVDSWADIVLFRYGLGTRKVLRLLYEGIIHPFDHPHPDQVFTINLEELASLWHLPGTVATTPGIKRVDSIKGDAPDNLPR